MVPCLWTLVPPYEGSLVRLLAIAPQQGMWSCYGEDDCYAVQVRDGGVLAAFAAGDADAAAVEVDVVEADSDEFGERTPV